ncbi:hypothetical protein N8T08_002915 [Aspergillus melleus]|uniref:Uncharacterized protein n=1 Tax=Aspergillus melleus TaxID=138277 RepID=A0ACC3B816_9EURO|nr:hypothetical protein N8T08_002915 [Aspergillus melleus]
MPLDEEGAKWSCEPCIRGHRSSKCQHFDRLMMKVPKAGRPLAKCPHPKGTCSCQKSYAFMIRIPKGTTCLCRPVYQVPVDPGDPAPAMTPAALVPTLSPAPGKIQKSSKRQVKTAPEAIAKALHSIPEFKKPQTGNGTPNGLSPFIGNSPDRLTQGADALVPAPFPPWQDFQATGQNHYMSPFSFDPPQSGTSAYPQNYLSQMPQNGSFAFANGGISGSIDFNPSVLPSSLPHEPQSVHHPAPSSLDNKTDHDCSCGEGCQCLGCASHPFNNTTRQHVQEMGLLVALDGEQTLEGFNGFQSPSIHANYPSVPPMNYSLPEFNHTLVNGTPHMGMQPYGQVETSSNQLSNGYSSPPAEYTPGQTLMEPSEYYTLEYPVGLPSGCSDVTGSCHGHDGFSLGATAAENIEAPTVAANELGVSTSNSEAMTRISSPSSTSML